MSGSKRGERALKAVKLTGGQQVGSDRRSRSSRATGGGSHLPIETVKLVRKLLAEGGWSRNQIAREAGCAGGTVTKIANETGHADAFDRSRTEVALAAKVADGKTRRALLAETLITAAQLDGERLTEARAGDQVELDTRQRADLARGIGALTRAAVDLDRLSMERARVESEQRGGSDMDDWLERIANGTAG